MSGEELVAMITGISIAIAKDKSVDELNLLSVIFTQLGDSLATIATKRDICSQSNTNIANSEKDEKNKN